MKKKILLILFIFILVIGFIFYKQKHLHNEVKTIIKNNKNTIIAINYPKTIYPKVNKKIEQFVNKEYKNFQKKYEKFINLDQKVELNIDYEYHKINNQYISIALYVYIDTHTLDSPIRKVETLLWNIKKNQYENIYTFIKNKKQFPKYLEKSLLQKYHTYNKENTLNKENIKNLPFFISDKEVTIFFPSFDHNYSYLLLKVPFSHFNLSINKSSNKLANYTVKNNVIDPKEKVIALTFDDGPSKYTNEVINLLKQYNINATFFILGNKVTLYKDTLKKLLQNGNEIGNHSYNHKWMIKLKEEELLNQIQQTQDIIKKELNYTPNNVRPTYGDVNKKMKEKINLNIVLWTVDTLDWKLKDSKQIAKRGMNVKDGDIILMHDSKKRTISALKIMIPKLLEQGYQFVTINELKEVHLVRKSYQ